jgi:hypothetical protein
MATVEQRRAACTHLNVTRLFDELGCQKCEMCGRTSSFGWLYRCTQDSNSFLPDSDFSPAKVESLDARLSEQLVTAQLSQDVLRGIQDGHYNSQQIRLLQAQKLRVKETIAMQEDALENHSQSYLASNSPSSPHAILDNSVMIARGTPEASEHQNANASGQAVKNPTLDQNEAHSVMPCASKVTYVEPLVPNCHFRCCQACRPAYRDRAFQSLDTVLTEPFKQPPLWEFENRRISDAHLLTKIAISRFQPQLRRRSQTFDDLWDPGRCRTCENSENEDIGSETKHKKRNVRWWSGFRQTVKKALGTVDQSESVAKSSKHSSKSSSRETFIQTSRSALFKRRSKQAEKDNQIVSNRALQESLVLMLAVNTPLPRALGNSDSLDGGEVKVKHGIAVTEEGIEMSAADIITEI